MKSIEENIDNYERSWKIDNNILLYDLNNGLRWLSISEYKILQRKKERKQKLKNINEKTNSTN